MNNIQIIDDLTSDQRNENILYYQEWKSMLSFSLDFPDITVCKSWLVASRFIEWLKEQGNIKDLIFMPCEDCYEWSPKTCKYIGFTKMPFSSVKLHPITEVEKIQEDKQLKSKLSEVWDENFIEF